jgi:hypothetical protein
MHFIVVFRFMLYACVSSGLHADYCLEVALYSSLHTCSFLLAAATVVLSIVTT